MYIEGFLHGSEHSNSSQSPHGFNLENENKYIDFRTSDFRSFHIALKVIFDYLGCLYIIKNLQNENFRYQSIEMERASNYEEFELSREGFSGYQNENFQSYGNISGIESVKIRIEFSRIDISKHVMVKADNDTNGYSLAQDLSECLKKSK